MILEYEKVILKISERLEKEQEVRNEFPELDYDEAFAYQHHDQWIGCLTCKKSHHNENFCKCGLCYFAAPFVKQDDYGFTLVKCKCGKTNLWD